VGKEFASDNEEEEDTDEDAGPFGQMEDNRNA
jgi:hypothetical protein